MNLALGSKVTYSHTVVKHKKPFVYVNYRAEPVPEGTVDTGIIVGRRTVMDYDVDHEYEGPIWATPKGKTSKRVWLVAYNLDRRPVMVLDQHITTIHDTITKEN